MLIPYQCSYLAVCKKILLIKRTCLFVLFVVFIMLLRLMLEFRG